VDVVLAIAASSAVKARRALALALDAQRLSPKLLLPRAESQAEFRPCAQTPVEQAGGWAVMQSP
jgi:hypothetical protein